MKAMMYMPGKQDPVAILQDIQIVEMNDNHKDAPYRVIYKTPSLNAGTMMVELHRETKLILKLEDGRTCNVLLQHSSLDGKGNSVGVLRVLDGLSEEKLA